MPIFYVRNDDANVLDEELVAVTRRCTDEGVPITHAVEPANVADEAVAWLRQEKAREPRLVEIMQHGYDHEKRDLGEFGGSRPYEDQKADLERGRDILMDKFGDDFLSCLNFPFGLYNPGSMRAADELGFRIISCHYNQRLSRRMFYKLGHLLRRGQMMGKHVSWHLDFYPGTGMYSVDVAASYITRYIGPHGSNTCEFHTLESMIERVESFIPHTPVIGVLLHHRYHHTPESLDLITGLIRHLKGLPGAEFLNMEEIYERFAPSPGRGFRHA